MDLNIAHMIEIFELLDEHETLRYEKLRLQSRLAMQACTAQNGLESDQQEMKSLESIINVKKDYLQSLKPLRKALNQSLLLNKYRKQGLIDIPPTDQEVQEKFVKLDSRFCEYTEIYQQSEIYQNILKEQALEKDLIKTINEKRQRN